MYHPRTITDKILLFIKGLAMGAANKVPGVSGGIVAFVVGFYEEFIYSLQKFISKEKPDKNTSQVGIKLKNREKPEEQIEI